jgi:hypothetical protein
MDRILKDIMGMSMEDEKVINVCFRRIFKKHPIYKVGDIVETAFGTRGRIIEVRKDKETFRTVDETVYLIEEENGKKQLYHSSAILGYSKPKQTTLRNLKVFI